MANPNQRPKHSRTRTTGTRMKKSGDNEDPKMIGQWKIGRTIGKGSSGRVKIARHVKTHQYAAIKIVSKTALLNSRISMTDAPAHAEKVLLCIEREIVIMKLIDHPNVLNLYDVWETANELYLIMEYVEGGELFDYLVSRGRIHADEALHYFQQIISAISYCHGFNIAHRDLKPENLLLSKSSTCQNIKVADFGMAAYTNPTALLSTSCGSPHYASPEVVEGKSYKGNVSDIWSCGVILYALLVGRLPFDHENLRILLEKVKMATYEPPKDVPASARDLISRMLEKDVRRRITMSQILKHPFFLSTAPSPSLLLSVQTPTLDELSATIEKPVQSEDDIDADIFDNMCTLWHGAPASDIIDGLLNNEKSWEKAVYYLLLKYRTKHLEHYNMDPDHEYQQRQRRSLQAETSQPLLCGVRSECVGDTCEVDLDKNPTQANGQGPSVTGNEAISLTMSARPTAPTPQRAVTQGATTFMEEETDGVASSPHRAGMISSPTAPQHPPTEPIDVFIVTPPRVSSTGLGPRHPPLPDLPEIHLPNLPMIHLQEATPARQVLVPVQTDLSSNASSSPAPSPIIGLPGIVMPNLDNVDETVQRFFHQIVEHLNTMQMWQSTASTSTRSYSATPEPSVKGTPGVTLSPQLCHQDASKIIRNHATSQPPHKSLDKADLDPDEIRFQDATEESTSSSPNSTTNCDVRGLGISDDRQSTCEIPLTIRPPFQQMQVCPPPPGRAYSKGACGAARHSTAADKRSRTNSGDKENTNTGYDTVSPQSVHLRKKSSLRSSEGKKGTLSNKHVQILLPTQGTEEPESEPRRALSTQSASDVSFFLPAGTTPRRSWFANLFKFKPASYHLLSVHDAYTTKEECARVLRGFGVAVSQDAELNGVLKCRLEEVRDPAGIMAVAKAVRFRVELHSVTHAHSVSGYVTSLTIVQEKGALSSFKLVYNRLRREWDLDTPPSTRIASSILY